MPLHTRLLRTWFAVAIAVLLVVVGAFYLRGYYARYLVEKAVKSKAEKLGIDIQHSTKDFKFVESVGGGQLFSIQAEKAVQVTSGEAELHNVNVVVYGKQGNRFDQIYGDSFAYDP